MVELRWRPEDRRAVGRPRETWRRTAEKERRQAGWNDRNNVRVVVWDRAQWKQRVTALCAYWHKKQ